MEKMYWEKIKDEWSWDNLTEVKSTNTEYKPNPTIYFDMDGTLAKFNKGAPMEEVFSPGYFRKLDPHNSMVWLAKRLSDQGFDVCILSKSCFSAIREKREWLKEHMQFIKNENIYFVPLDADKKRFVPPIKPIDVLIDDYWKNLTEDKWSGTAIKCVTDINTKDPTLPWVELDTTPTKNMRMVTWAMLRNFAYEAQKGHVDIYTLRFIKEHCGLEQDDFYSMCDGFSIDPALSGYYKNFAIGNPDGKLMDVKMERGRYLNISKDYDVFHDIYGCQPDEKEEPIDLE